MIIPPFVSECTIIHYQVKYPYSHPSATHVNMVAESQLVPTPQLYPLLLWFFSALNRSELQLQNIIIPIRVCLDWVSTVSSTT